MSMFKAVSRGVSSTVGGYSIGEKINEGDRRKAAWFALLLFTPLLWRKRMASLTMAVGAALIGYYFADLFNQDETTEDARVANAAQTASMN